MERGLIPGLILVLVVWAGTLETRDATAQASTPTSVAETSETIALVEHSDHATDVDLGAPGPSAGDIRVWGPNPLYGADNVTDMGARTHGVCIALNAELACVLTETIVFPDGSTLEFQGVEQSHADRSTRTIVGGSGRYLGAIGSAVVEPTENLAIWHRTITLDLR